MNLRRAAFIAACLFPIATGPAMAQFPPQQPPAASPWDQQPPQQQQQQEKCVQDFMKLRGEAEKRAGAIRAASERKATAKEACTLFNAFSTAEVKMIKFAADNATKCGIPAQIVDAIKQGHAKTTEMRSQVCRAAAAPVRPQGPSLSDVLGGSAVPDANNIKTGRGTFDTLTGSPLGSK
jgi:hypothetical protein